MRNKKVYIVLVSFPYEGGWIVGVYNKESIAKRICTKHRRKERKDIVKIIPCILNKQLKGNIRYT